MSFEIEKGETHTGTGNQGHDVGQREGRQGMSSAKRRIGFALLIAAGLLMVVYTFGALRGEGARYYLTEAEAPAAEAAAPAPPAPQLNALGYLAAADTTSKSVAGINETENQTPSFAAGMDAGATQQSYLIKRANVQVEVEDARNAKKAISAAVAAAGGYVSQSSESMDHLGRRSVSLELRVPVDKLDGALETIDTLGRVLNSQIATEDVTEEYIDTEARVRNLRKTEERLLDHLSRTSQIDNTLKIEQEVARAREQLERLEGRQRFLDNRIRFSTISMTIMEKSKAEPILAARAFSSAQVFSEAVRSLVVFAQSIWVRMIWAAVWSPVWGAAALLIGLATWRVRVSRRKRLAA